MLVGLLASCGGGTTPQTEAAFNVLTAPSQRPDFAHRINRKCAAGLRACEPDTTVAAGGDGTPSTPPPASPSPTSPTPDPAPSTGTEDVGCGPDIGGWTAPTPTAVDKQLSLKSAQQRGSRIYYVSAAKGSDATGEIYFWDGSQIIDATGSAKNSSGVAYGSDPTKPSAAVKPFKRWAFVGPRRDNSSDIGTAGVVGGPTTSFRAGFPDWWLFSRGETFDLAADLLSFARESNPAATTAEGSLTVPGGRSPTERQVITAYGDVCQPRPRFIHPISNFVASFRSDYTAPLKNVAYLSLHFDGHDRPAGSDNPGVVLLAQTTQSTDILFEDMWLDATNVNIGSANSAQVTLRRSLITDNFSTNPAHVQGVYYEGTRQGVLRIEESILLRNGFLFDPKTTWPPSGAQTWHIFNRNMYISGEADSMRSGLFDSISMLGASGDQFRTGARLERNFFYQGSVGIGAQGGYPDSDGPTGTVLDNVLQKFLGTGTDDNRGQPGWGFIVGGGAYAVEVARNIVTGAQYAADTNGLIFMPLFQDCPHVLAYPTRSNNVHDNVFDTAKASAAIGSTDGVTTASCFNWVFRGVKGNAVSDNVLINANAKESEYLPVGAAVGTSPDTSFARNRMFADRRAASAALGWTDPDRTLKTYLQSRGVSVTSTDGFPEYFKAATQQRRGQWRPDWTATPLVNYFRAGFAMPALATQ